MRIIFSLLMAILAFSQAHGQELNPIGVVVDISSLVVQKEKPKREISLRAAIGLALENNRELQSAYLQRNEDKIRLRSAEELFSPKVELVATAEHSGIGDTAGFDTSSRSIGLDARVGLPTGASATLSWSNPIGNESSATIDDGSVTTISLSQPLLQGGGLAFNTAPVKIARLQEQENLHRLKATAMQIVQSVIVRYRQQVLASVQVEISRRALKRSKNQLEVNSELVKAGRLARRETAQAETEIIARQLDLSEALDAENQARLDLLDVLDIDLDTQWVANNELSLGEFADITQADALRIAYQNKPSLLQLLVGKEIAEINQKNQQNSNLWRLDLTAELTSSGSSATVGMNDSELDRGSSNTHSAGLRLSIPIGEPYGKKELLSANIEIQQQSNSIEEHRDAIQITIGQLVNQIKRQRSRVDIASQLVKLAETQFAIEQVKLTEGLSSNFTISEFETRVVQAQIDEITAKVTYLNRITQLNATMGTLLKKLDISLTRGGSNLTIERYRLEPL